MSRIGKRPIKIFDDVKVDIQKLKSGASVVTIQGPLGTLTHQMPSVINVVKEDNNLILSLGNINKKNKALWGLYRSLIANSINGVVKGYSKDLEIVGIGYRAEMKADNELILSLGYSHKIHYRPPAGVTVSLIDQNNIRVFGIDKQKVGEVAAKIRSFRKPEPYKGKGIRYKGEKIIKKSTKQ
ncbi:MAG: 50S ribosomal protein L6 [Candidatus Dojkabacteria bacterium]|nr:50S ribosomal protein L6 [Candidatus Dojkabacteria bacterium]